MQIELEELQPKLVVAQADNEKMMVVRPRKAMLVDELS